MKNIKEIIILSIISALFPLYSYATILFPSGGGTGIGTATTTDVGKFLQVSSSSPLQYTFSSGGGGGSVTINGMTNTTFTIAGTSNQVNITNGGNTVTISTPQDISPTSMVTFNGITVTNATTTKLIIGTLNGILNSINGLVGTTTISSPLVYDTGTGTLTIQMASSTSNGYLSSTDWSTFNGKLSTTTASSTYVPYSGANSNVDLNTKNLTNINQLGLTNFEDLTATNTPSSPPSGFARIFSYSTQGHTRPAYMDDDGNIITIARDNFVIAKNTSGSSIATATPVYITGSTGNVPNISPAGNSTTTTMPAIGLTMNSIGNNNFGYVMKLGILSNINTSAYSSGDLLYVSSTAGSLTNIRPSYPNLVQAMASVLVSGNGNGSIAVITAPFVGGRETGTISPTFNVGGNLVVTTSTSPLSIDGNGKISCPTCNISTSTGQFGISIDGSNSVIATGTTQYIKMPFSGTLTGWNMTSDQSGTASIDVWKATNSIPTSANTITGGNYASLSSQQLNSSTNLSGWTTSFSTGDVFGFNVTSTPLTVTKVSLGLIYSKQ